MFILIPLQHQEDLKLQQLSVKLSKELEFQADIKGVKGVNFLVKFA